MAINREKVLEAAQKYIEKRKYDKAVVELRRVVDADPSDARTLHKIGELQAKQNLIAEAVDTFERAAKLYADGGFAQKAVAVYKQIREMIARQMPQLEIRYGHIAPRLAELYRELGLGNEALALLEEVANGHLRQGRELEAVECFKQIASIDTQNPLAHLRVAEALSRARDIDGAVAEFEAAATLLIEADRRDDALQVLERLLQHRPDPRHARVCAELYLARSRPPHDGMYALTKLQLCFQANPRDVAVLSLLVRAFHMIGQIDKATEIQREIARLTQAR
ncbi:MAG: tetratricopeptide repeat protein [Labilithrix sp.]|nr:tetratricopeptide repeat protein [Labilithrix sp.]